MAKQKVLVTLSDEQLAWLDKLAEQWERDRSWMLAHAVEMWRKRLERERRAASQRRGVDRGKKNIG